MAVIDTTGSAAAAETQVNTSSTGHQLDPSVASLANGGWVVVWDSAAVSGGNRDIFGQRYEADGTRAGGEFLVNTFTAYDQVRPVVAALPGGGFVVAWSSQQQDGAADGVYAQRYGGAGTPEGAEFRVNTLTSSYENGPSVTPMSDGGFLVAFERHASSNFVNYTVLTQRYAADGTPVGGETSVAPPTRAGDAFPQVTGIADGGYAVAWRDFDASDTGIYVQVFAATGVARRGVQLANVTTTRSQMEHSMAPLEGGGFVVAWRGDQVGNGQDTNVYARTFKADGSASSAEFQVNNTLPGTQGEPDVASLADGRFLVTWTSSQSGAANPYDIYGRIFDDSGTPVGDESVVNAILAGDQYASTAIGLPGGGYVVAWTTNRPDGPDVMVRKVAVAGATITGTDNDDTIIVTDASLVNTSAIDGRGGSDVLRTNDSTLDLSRIAVTNVESITTTRAEGTRLTGSSGDDHFVGAGRADSFVDAGVRRDYVVAGSYPSTTVSGPLGSDTLSGVEEIQFRDGRLVYNAQSPAAMTMRFYVVGLDRAPDSLGFNHWLDTIGRDGPGAVAIEFAASPEFAAHYGSLDNAAFVTQMYRDGLGREPDPGGRDFWVGLLDRGGTRAQVLEGFANSNEAIDRTHPLVAAGLWDQDEGATMIERVYDAGLGRLPTRAEFDAAMSRLDAGSGYTGLSATVAGTAEFSARYGSLDNGSYVDALYRDALGRPADPGGRAYWLDALQNGVSRGDVMFGFAASPEHDIRFEPTIQDGVQFQPDPDPATTFAVALTGLPAGPGG